MSKKESKISCREIAIRLNEIKTKKLVFDDVVKTDVPKALILKKEIQELIKQLKEILNPVFKIEGKEFPVFSLEIGGKTGKELEDELLSKSIRISGYAQDMLRSSEFTTSPTVKNINLVRLSISDLGLPNSATTDEIYAKAQELGLELCPAEVGPHQRLIEANQPCGGNYGIAMKQITDRDGNPDIFVLDRPGVAFWLISNIAKPEKRLNVTREIVFQVPSEQINKTL